VKSLVNLLANLVRRSPWGVLAGALIVTLVFGAFTPQQEMASGNEGFSPDSPEFLAQDIISENFSDNSEEPVQIVMTARGTDLLTADGCRDYLAVQEAIKGSDVQDLLKDRPGGDIVGYFDPLLQGLQQRSEDEGIPFEALVSGLSDQDVKAGFKDALDQIPPEFADLFTGLLAEGSDLTAPASDTGLMVVFLNVADLDDPDQTILQEKEVDMAEAVEAAGTTASDGAAFSFALLFANADEFQSEIGRLFGTAFLIIVVILLFVYWMTRHESRRYGWMAPGWGRALRIGLIPGAAVALALTLLYLILVLVGKEPTDLPVVIVWAFVAVTALGTSYARFARWRRSWADMGVTMLVIIMSITWMNGIGVLLGPKYLGVIGNFSEILQIIPILLIGLGVDYAIHMTSRYREELGEGEPVVEAAGRATRTVGIALVLATVTTSVGFLTNVVNPITAIADFGILAAVGITSAFILMLTVVPSIRVLLDRRAEAAETLPRQVFAQQGERLLPNLMGRSSILAQKVPRVTLAVALLLGAAGAYGYTELNTEFSFTDFLPEDAPALETFTTITEEFGGGFGEETEVIIEGDVATVEVHNAIAVAWGNLATTPNVVQFGDRAAAESPVSVIGQLVTPPDQGGDPEAYHPAFALAATSAGLQADLTVAPGTDVDALYREALAVADDPMRRVIAEVDGAFLFVDVGVSTQAGESGALTLRDDLQSAFQPVRDAGASTVATNQNIISQGVAQSLRDSQLSSLFLTVLVAGLILVINFWFESRRPGLGLITILPVALIVLLVFGIMAARGIPFNPVTAMIANLAIGIGVPYTIHITHRYQEDRLRFATPEEAIRSTTTHTGGALAGSAFTTAAGFGVLITSTLKPFQQFGEVTFWSIVTAMVGAVFVLPSLLVLWDRWHRSRGEAVLDESAVHGALQDAGSVPD
jgi:predicted RND superfamily exporter protein